MVNFCFVDSPVRVGLRSPAPFFSPPMSFFSSKEESSWDSFQPLSPDVCLTQVWQETQVAVRYNTLNILFLDWDLNLSASCAFLGAASDLKRKALGLFNRFHASGAESTDCVSILICFQLLYFYSCISLKIVPQLKRDLIKSYFVNANFTLSCFNSRYGTKGKASKAFLTKDKSGATFLCYLLGQLEKLR